MTEIRESALVGRPPAAVFEYVSDFARWPEWRLSLSDARVVTPGPIGPGTRVLVQGEVLGRHVEMDVEILEYEPAERIGFRTLSGPVLASGTFCFEPEGGGTRVSVVGAVEPAGLLRAMAPLVTHQVRAMWHADLEALRGVLAKAT